MRPALIIVSAILVVAVAIVAVLAIVALNLAGVTALSWWWILVPVLFALASVLCFAAALAYPMVKAISEHRREVEAEGREIDKLFDDRRDSIDRGARRSEGRFRL